jgi:HEAT repeat protein
MCLSAARALAHIDPVRAVDVVWPRLLARQDWPVPQVATMLREADGARVGDALLRSLPELPPAGRRRLLPLVALLDEARAGEAVRALLSTAEDQDSLAVALQLARSPALVPEAVRLATHPAWPVRTQAASALGRLGGPSERPCLVGLLSDPEWWVRYRAAQALRAERFGGPAALAALAPGLSDRFARDMIAHVLAEGAP